MPDSEPAAKPVAPFQVQLVAAAVMAAPVVYAVIIGVLSGFGWEPVLDAETAAVMGPVVLIVGAASALSCFFIRSAIIARLPEPRSLSDCFRAVIVSMAVAESAAVLGLVYFLLTGRLVLSVGLLGLSFVLCAFLFPTRRYIDLFLGQPEPHVMLR